LLRYYVSKCQERAFGEAIEALFTIDRPNPIEALDLHHPRL